MHPQKYKRLGGRMTGLPFGPCLAISKAFRFSGSAGIKLLKLSTKGKRTSLLSPSLLSPLIPFSPLPSLYSPHSHFPLQKNEHEENGSLPHRFFEEIRIEEIKENAENWKTRKTRKTRNEERGTRERKLWKSNAVEMESLEVARRKRRDVNLGKRGKRVRGRGSESRNGETTNIKGYHRG